MSLCNNCGSDQSQVDTVQGVSFCTSCGMVLEENIIVSSINFTDDGIKSSLTGKIIDLESTQVGTQYVDSSFYIKNTIRNICSNLGLPTYFIDLSYRLYRLLLPYNLSKGKSLLYTLSAVIYCNCRLEKTPHLLIDFSTSLNLDVFKIGRSFTKICEVLGLQIPQVDPSLYIQRFIVKLKLKNPKIGPMALRIVSRMDRDWISTGRRPNNLCGAAILIASRIYNEERSILEISKVVHVAESTIKIRLEEIKNTKTSELSIEDFNKKWIEKEEEPPIIKKRGRRKGGIDVGDMDSREGGKDREESKAIGKENLRNKNNDDENSSEEEDHNPLSDDSYLLTEDESKIRTAIWNEMYEDFLKEKALKMKVVIKPKRRRKNKQYNTVSDVLKSLNKRISSKINYKAIENIFEGI
ncbi:Transcription factor IIIB 90 kDa subunit [Nosema bombycis CQ1]|uniref:Transcription factor IIIB 90 kDa subunit n=1 Tax=Nosema bombycis (strain CQ1 / CVCC 102059) TaxID=578461 RepID=R0MFW4_NOSB1|nr:Transcription factor IIIB 90 kDa subunit [Nosema bombycis CQ1]|eukprot:EOB11653.1 Transcription factor IIIB 90 kDa subunit [Nosema bombycis CQ1]